MDLVFVFALFVFMLVLLCFCVAAVFRRIKIYIMHSITGMLSQHCDRLLLKIHGDCWLQMGLFCGHWSV